MKRSFIDAKIKEGIELCRQHNFNLPKWAHWTAEKWNQMGHEADDIRLCRLGWDVSDFGSNDYDNLGILAFTIRNGDINRDPTDPMEKDYCEKLIILAERQLIPTHFHWTKMEDIINRSGGRMVIQLWNADRDTEQIDKSSDVTISIDSIVHTVPAGGKVTIDPGESITLGPYMYHNFYAEKGKGPVIAGEVSRVNDDDSDNCFSHPPCHAMPVSRRTPPQFIISAPSIPQQRIDGF